MSAGPVNPDSQPGFPTPTWVVPPQSPAGAVSTTGAVPPAELDPALAQAYGREGSGLRVAPSLRASEPLEQAVQRGPEGPPPPTILGDPAADADGLWRDPAVAVALDDGAGRIGDEPREPAPRLGIRDVIFGNRVSPTALAALGLAALLIGGLGGLVGRLSADVGLSLTDREFTLAAPVSPGAGAAEVSGVAAVAARVLPAVVSIELISGEMMAFGSGVVFDSAGYIMTNNHVVSLNGVGPEVTMTVIFHDGTRVPANIVGVDPKTDIAVIKVRDPVNNLTVAALGDSAALAVGDAVIAVGSPLGLAGTVTSGIVSAVERPFAIDTAAFDAIQTDAAINHGNSGGPLINSAGEVVGINTSIVSPGGEDAGSIGLGFAVPINDAGAIAQELIRSGSIVHPGLGINARSASNELSTGAYVANVVDGGPAAAAGIVEGDVIKRLGDRSVASAEELTVAVRQHRVGESVPVTLIRSGATVEVSVTLGPDAS